MTSLIVDIEEVQNVPMNFPKAPLSCRLQASLYNQTNQTTPWSHVLTALPTPGTGTGRCNLFQATDITQLGGLLLNINVQRQVSAGGLLSAAKFVNSNGVSIDLQQVVQSVTGNDPALTEELRQQQSVVLIKSQLISLFSQEQQQQTQQQAPPVVIRLSLTAEKVQVTATTAAAGVIYNTNVPLVVPEDLHEENDPEFRDDRDKIVSGVAAGKLGFKYFSHTCTEKLNSNAFSLASTDKNVAQIDTIRNNLTTTSMSRVMGWFNAMEHLVEPVQISPEFTTGMLSSVQAFGQATSVYKFQHNVNVVYRRKP